jgi:membrane associated rhomboid family serine protease
MTRLHSATGSRSGARWRLKADDGWGCPVLDPPWLPVDWNPLGWILGRLMLPIRDDNPTARVPWVTRALIVVCLLVFAWQLLGQDGEEDPTLGLAMVPARVLQPGPLVHKVPAVDWAGRLRYVEAPLPSAAVPDWLTLLTCIFLHGGWLHLLGNVWVLWIFGDNVEDRFGRWQFLMFYLLCGTLASLAHLLANPGSLLPTVGASGAIAGVMGAYLLLYPKARVLTVLPIFVLIQLVELPAAVFLLLWLSLQVLNVLVESGLDRVGGVAWWAHIGGFLAGMAAAAVMRSRGWLRPELMRSGWDGRVYRIGRRRPGSLEGEGRQPWR